MVVRNLSPRRTVRRATNLFLVALWLLMALSAPADAADSTPIPRDPAAGRQTMGFEYLRDTPSLLAYGITADLMGQPLNSLLNGTAAMRLNWIRQPVHWADIEPEEGSYSWEMLDPVVSEVRIRGFHLLLVVDGTPTWALTGLARRAEDGPPADTGMLIRFLDVLSARYAGLVDAYQIWQSPNVGTYWNGRPDPQAYGRLLQMAYRAIKAADPGTLVVSADVVLGPSESEPGFVNGLKFLDEMIRIGAADACDALGVTFDPPVGSPDELLEGAQRLSNRHGGVPIWITRAGWSCPEAESATMPACEERQADYLVQFAAKVDGLDFVEAFMVDNFNLSTVDVDHPAAARSLIRSDWSPRPAFLQFARMRQQQAMATQQMVMSAARNRASQTGPKPFQ